MNSSLSIRHLRAFCEVALCGSFTRAAGNLHLTQSTLTATIKQLEQDVGLTLFDRTTRRVILTNEGEQFQPVAERLISDFDTALTDLRATSEQQKGQVSVAASPSTISHLLPPVIQQYHREYPNISISLRDENAAQIEQLVLSNEVDFGIGANHSSNNDLHYEALIKDRYGVVVSNESELFNATELNWQQLEQSPLLYLSADTGIRVQLDQLRKQSGISIENPQALIEVSTPSGIAALIKQQLGISVLPALAASTESFKGLKFIPLREPVIERNICLITRKGRSLSPAGLSMMQMSQQHLLSMPLPAYLKAVR
ncbi:LysR family transcriptional regulator [Amphritea balenae]|uniref:LysR family transcriptional regulator n=1 Tax=Amphritea balenae TaxID=452629 RepID=A0A3P1SLD0_9GAMM|nr:LysR family transcriptional regulator [Amphritea balenae]RRC98073.1 LysR family transcriptional regulator [Amphritea balenae]GGK67342.1 LysR family transcriptional regulator [Amphritea balenae]